MIQAYLVALLVAMSAGLGGLVWGVDIGVNKQKAHDAEVIKAVNAAGDKAAEAAADAVAKIEVVNKTIYQKATHEVRTNTVYADCVNTDSMFLNLNNALRRPAARTGAGGVPGSDTAAGKGLRGDGSQVDRSGGPVLQVPGSGAGRQ